MKQAKMMKEAKRAKQSRNLKICLAASIGGHFTEILELKEVYEKYDYFFVTNLGTQTISMLTNEKKYFIPRRVEKKSAFFKQLFLSLEILLKEKPDVIITTGSGDMFWICLLGKLLRKEVVCIESFAMTTNQSKFGKVIYKFADLFVYQWEKLKMHYPEGIYGGWIFDFSKFANNDYGALHKGNGADSYFIIVGTLPNDFPRLLRKVDELIEQGVIDDKVFAQIGHSKYIPKNYEYTDFIPDTNEFESKIKESSIVITHGGVGSIMTALKFNKRIIVVPRYRKFDEIANDHQLDITQELERQGKIIAVYDRDNLDNAIRKTKEKDVKVTIIKNLQMKKILRNWLEKEETR